MAKVFITGSADGLGFLTAKSLIDMGHEVVLHARNELRAKDTMSRLSEAAGLLIADLSSIKQMRRLAQEANALGRFDAIIHNAGVYQVSGTTEDGLPLVFAVNTIAPYILTSLMLKPERLVFLSSGMHLSGNANVSRLSSNNGMVSYSDTKLHDLILAMAIARKYPAIYSNAVDPGWVPTKMGGRGAPDDLQKGFETQIWLATSNDVTALVSGKYFHHKQLAEHLTIAEDIYVQDALLAQLEKLTGVKLGDID